MEFRGHTIAKTGPWGQGPALLQTLAILEGFDDRYLDPSTELGAHTILEAQKLALADREAYYGDTDVPLEYLLSAEYCAGRRALIGERASHDFRPGAVPGREPYRAATADPATRRRRSRAQPRFGRARRGRAHRGAERGDPRRHLPYRRRGPLGQHGLGHAVGRLAAVLARPSRNWASASAPGCR